MNRFDLLLYAGAALFAVMSLVRLMLARRDRLIAEVQQQLESQKKQRNDF
ncbi:MAG: hypothetical protein WD851_06490 [Pirellulales bacterium]